MLLGRQHNQIELNKIDFKNCYKNKNNFKIMIKEIYLIQDNHLLTKRNYIERNNTKFIK